MRHAIFSLCKDYGKVLAGIQLSELPSGDYGRGTGTMPEKLYYNLYVDQGMTVKQLKEQLTLMPNDAEIA